MDHCGAHILFSFFDIPMLVFSFVSSLFKRVLLVADRAGVLDSSRLLFIGLIFAAFVFSEGSLFVKSMGAKGDPSYNLEVSFVCGVRIAVLASPLFF